MDHKKEREFLFNVYDELADLNAEKTTELAIKVGASIKVACDKKGILFEFEKFKDAMLETNEHRISLDFIQIDKYRTINLPYSEICLLLQDQGTQISEKVLEKRYYEWKELRGN
jgi:hypothetical protein